MSVTMKKNDQLTEENKKKLVLARTTLRLLTEASLDEVRGGVGTRPTTATKDC
jgi:hypothetical protein